MIKIRPELLDVTRLEDAVTLGLASQKRYSPKPVFSKNWSWASVTDLNRRICEGGKADFGLAGNSGGEIERIWTGRQFQEESFLGTIAFLKECHRSAPFLNFNGNTFSAIGRLISGATLAPSPTSIGGCEI